MNTPPMAPRPTEVPMAPRKVKPDDYTYDENTVPVGRCLLPEFEKSEYTEIIQWKKKWESIYQMMAEQPPPAGFIGKIFNIKPKMSTTTLFLDAFNKMSDDNKKKVTEYSFFRLEKVNNSEVGIILNGVLDRRSDSSSEFNELITIMKDIIKEWSIQYKVCCLHPQYTFDYRLSYDKFLALLDILGLEHPPEEYQGLFKPL